MSDTQPSTPKIEYLELAQIDECECNPRRTFTAMDELAADIRQRGVLQPILVRPRRKGRSQRFEIVFGARRLRASRMAGLNEIPAVVRDMDDRTVLETQVVENSQREDVHPLEEADGFAALVEQHQVEVDDLAARVGKSRAYVYQRLKLRALVDEARDAFMAGKLNAGTALLVARLPWKLQKPALHEITSSSRRDDEPMSVRDAQHFIERTYMLDLGEAGFDTTSAELVPEAGPCTTCPKRTGNQPELFADVQSRDTCTDPACFKEKRDAAWKLRSKQARATGARVLTREETSKAFPYGHHLGHSSGFVDLDERCDADPKHRTWRKLLGQQPPEVALARDPGGKARELVSQSAATRALREAGHSFAQPPQRAERKPGEIKTANREKRIAAIERLARARVLARAGALAGEVNGDGVLPMWRAVARGILVTGWTHVASEALGEIVQRRCAGATTRRTLSDWIDRADEPELLALVAEVLLSQADTWTLRDRIEEPKRKRPKDGDDDLTFEEAGAITLDWDLAEAAALFGVNVAEEVGAVTRDVDAFLEVAAERKKTREKGGKKAAAKKTSRAAAKPAKSARAKRSRGGKDAAAGESSDDGDELDGDVPTCRVCGCTDMQACPGGCSWVEPDLCSACADTEDLSLCGKCGWPAEDAARTETVGDVSAYAKRAR